MSRKFVPCLSVSWRDLCSQLCQSHAVSENFPNLPAAVESYIARGRVAVDLAKAMGVTEASVSRWRNGGEPDVKRLQQLAKELGVTVAYLAGDSEAAQTQVELDHLRRYRAASEKDRAIVDAALSDYTPPSVPNQD